MSRKHIWYFLRDLQGKGIPGAALKLYLAGTKELATIYTIPTSGSNVPSAGSYDVLDQSTWTTDPSGFFEFYIGDFTEKPPKTGYLADQFFDFQWVASGGEPLPSGGLYDRSLFPLIFPVDETDTNEDVDKVISNQQAYTFEEHIPIQYDTGIHGLEPVDVYNSSDASYNKLVSDDLMRILIRDLTTLITCGGDAITIETSGALLDQTSVTSWTLSADGSYYADFPYVLERANMYPIIQFYDTERREQIIPRAVKDINTSVIRAWLTEADIDVTATIVGQVIS